MQRRLARVAALGVRATARQGLHPGPAIWRRPAVQPPRLAGPRWASSSRAAAAEIGLVHRLQTKISHLKNFLLSYKDGLVNLFREFRVAGRLVWRSWALGHRSSRKEAAQMRQSARDLAKVLPVASMILVLGAELSTIGILRFLPSLLPRAIRQKVTPAAEDLGILPERQEDQQTRIKMETLKRLGAATKQVAHKMSSDLEDPGAMPQIVAFIEKVEDPELLVELQDVLDVAPLFRAHVN